MNKKDPKQNKTLMDKIMGRLVKWRGTGAETTPSSAPPSIEVALGELMAPYLRAGMSVRQRQVALAIAVMAWNCSLLPEEEALKEIRAVQANLEPADRGELAEIVAAIQVRKEELYPWGTQTIQDAKLVPQEGSSFKLSVVLVPRRV
jgi:hypothetical protein